MSRPLAILVMLLLALVACDSDPESTLGGASPGADPTQPGSQPPESSEAPSGSGPTMTDEALGVEVAAEGFEFPTGIAFIGESDYFVIEKVTGEVHRVTDGEPG